MQNYRDFKRISPELIEAYRKITPPTLGHTANLRFMDSAIKPIFPGAKLVGPAFTVWAPGMDISAIITAADLIQPGDIMVVDRGGDYNHACLGEFRALKDIRRGVQGWVIDGATTDIADLIKMRFPTFCRTASALVGKVANVQGRVGVPIHCGGVVVQPGELIVADDDGIVVLSEEEAREHLEHGLEVEARERKMRKEYAAEYKKLL